ncbi:MAG: hypothetical protein Q8L29_01340 [archaeon]|nr:hypothetical protein [archaeon]
MYRLSKEQKRLCDGFVELSKRQGIEIEIVSVRMNERVGRAVDEFCERVEESYRVTSNSRQVFKRNYEAA